MTLQRLTIRHNYAIHGDSSTHSKRLYRLNLVSTILSLTLQLVDLKKNSDCVERRLVLVTLGILSANYSLLYKKISEQTKSKDCCTFVSSQVSDVGASSLSFVVETSTENERRIGKRLNFFLYFNSHICQSSPASTNGCTRDSWKEFNWKDLIRLGKYQLISAS